MTPMFITAAVLGTVGFVLGVFALAVLRPFTSDRAYQVFALLVLAAATAVAVWRIIVGG
jgi:hypothetical protein